MQSILISHDGPVTIVTINRPERRSALEQWELEECAAIDNEMVRGLETLRSGETLAGAQRFTGGAGRHGKFE